MNIDGQNSLTRKRGLVDFSLHCVFAAKSCEKNNSAKVVAPLFLSFVQGDAPRFKAAGILRNTPQEQRKGGVRGTLCTSDIGNFS